MKALAFLLIPLVVTMVFGMPMKSYADPHIDMLLNIATHARDSLGITISQINNVPDEINQLYKQGSNETNELAQADAQQNTDSANQHYLAAMKFFKETNDEINLLNATATNDQQKTEITELQGEIGRLEDTGNRLKSIALQNNVDINFTNFYGILQNATQNINSGNLDDAEKQIQNANAFVTDTDNSFTEAAKEKNTVREKDFTEEQITLLNVTSYSNNTGSSTGPLNVTQNNMTTKLPPEEHIVNNSNITLENNPNDMVAKLKQLVAEGKLNQAINLIKIIHSHQKEYLAQEHPEVASVNNTLPTPPTHNDEVNQTASRHVAEQAEQVKRHNEDNTSDKKQHHEN